MTRTVFSTLTDGASTHLDRAYRELTKARDINCAPEHADHLAAVIDHHRDLTAALVHLGRTVRGRELRRDSSIDRLLADLEQRAKARPWTHPEHETGPALAELCEASRCVRAAADLWATHRTSVGDPRSPEASRLRHPSMIGAATRHWLSLVAKSASLAGQVVELGRQGGMADIAVLTEYPRPPRVRERPQPLQLPLARPGLRRTTDPLDAVGDRVDRVHRHVWEVAQQQRMTAPVLQNVAAIGLLLGRAAAEAERAAQQPRATRPSPRALDPAGFTTPLVTVGDQERWAAVAAALTPLRTLDAPTTVLQVERLDLARLLERILGSSRSSRKDRAATVADQLVQASLAYRAVAAPCATRIRAMQREGQLYLAGRRLPPHLLARRDFVAARLTDRLVPAPAGFGRRLEALLHAVAAASGTDSAA